MIERDTQEQDYICRVVLWCWTILAAITEAIGRSVAYVVNCVYAYSRYYEIRIAVIGMKNSGKSTFVAALKQHENGDGGFREVERDTVPTLVPQVTNIVLREQGFGVDKRGHRDLLEGNDGRQSKNVNDTAVSPYGTGGSGGEDEVAGEDREGNSFDVWSNYIRSMKSGKTLKSIRSIRSMRSSSKDHEESSPLLADENLNTHNETLGREEDHIDTRARSREKVVVRIHDLSGQAKHVHLWEDYLLAKRSDCIVYVMDLSDRLTIRESREKLWELLRYNNSNDRLPFLIVGNKADLVDWRTAFADGYSSTATATGTSPTSHQRQVMAWLGLQAKGDCSTGVVLTAGAASGSNDTTLLHFDVAVFVVSVLREDVAPIMLRWALGAGGEKWAGGVL